jgi:transposase
MYETDLTDSQWQVMQNVLPVSRRKYDLRLIVNTLLYLTKSGCQWRLLPNDFSPYPLCFFYCRCWQADGRWAQLNKALVELDRRHFAPSGQPLRKKVHRSGSRKGSEQENAGLIRLVTARSATIVFVLYILGPSSQ